MGTPKALLRDRAGVSLLARSIGVLLEAGCAEVVVVTGASADEAAAVLGDTGWNADPAVRVVVAEDWREGMGASLRSGLCVLHGMSADSALVSLVDLPDVGAAVARRVLERLGCHADVLGRASYDGVAGHPVLIGRNHWRGVIASATGDRGARDYLEEHRPELVECGDLATGRDVDVPDDLPSDS